MKILGPLFFSIIIIIIYTYLLIKYWKLLNLRDLKYKKFLFILRLVLLSLIIILIIDPFIEKNLIEKKKPEVGIVFDLSESISKHLDGNIQVIENVRKYFDKWALENNYLLNFYKLDEKIKFLKNYDIDAVNTSFMDIPGFIDRNNFREIFLLTDGIATSGKYIADINYDSSIPINLIGIGPYNLKQDLKIEKVILTIKNSLVV